MFFRLNSLYSLCTIVSLAIGGGGQGWIINILHRLTYAVASQCARVCVCVSLRRDFLQYTLHTLTSRYTTMLMSLIKSCAYFWAFKIDLLSWKAYTHVSKQWKHVNFLWQNETFTHYPPQLCYWHGDNKLS